MTTEQLFADQQKSATAFMCRHFVALSVNYDAVERDGAIKHSKTAILSGWLLEMHGTCFWITAGHCLQEELDDNIKAGYIRVTGGGFMDYLGYEATHHHLYPYTYEPGSAIQLCRMELGLDFALLPLDALTRAAFLKNNNIPVTRENWIHQPTLSFDFYRMLGIPADRVIESENNTVCVGPVLMGINRITYDEAKGIPHVKSPEWFFGKIPPEVTHEVIKGMSGGPIYGFRRDEQGRMLYHVVALQSWWDSKERVVFGCPVLNFAETLYELMGWRDEAAPVLSQEIEPIDDWKNA